jgi:hypothetical protein
MFVDHDPLVCGIFGPGVPTGCPGCVAEARAAGAPRVVPHGPAPALARRLRREGAGRREAERLALAQYQCSPTAERGEAVLASVAAAFAGPAPRRRLARRVLRAVVGLLDRELPALVEAVVRRALSGREVRQ